MPFVTLTLCSGKLNEFKAAVLDARPGVAPGHIVS